MKHQHTAHLFGIRLRAMRNQALLGLCLAIACTSATQAALSIPSDGSDGVFAPATSVEIDLGQATTGAWDASNAATPGKGRYDASKWACVFKYSSVNIPSGVTVTFKNHPSYAPVVWLVSGNVTIAGTVSIAGKSPANNTTGRLVPTEPGPGGFRGGATGPSGEGGGFGIGGGMSGPEHGFYYTRYGNPQILPLIGGSGGSSSFSWDRYAGGGGGAILIGCANVISVSGMIDANGGVGTFGNFGPPNGSGGAIKLIAEQVIGTGSLRALNSADTSAYGRIRIETPSMSPSLIVNPNTVAVPPASPPQIWPAATAPTVKVLSIDGVAAPVDPTARLDTASDVAIQKNTAVDVIVQTTNFPTSGVVQVRDVKKYGNATWTNCTLTGTGNTFAQSNWKATITFSGGFTTLQARATVP